MSTPSLSYLALDASYDPIFDPAQSLTGVNAVAQDILTRLKLWYGEWWENTQLGLPVLQIILAQPSSQQGQTAMVLAIQSQIALAPYVLKILDVQTAFTNGQFSYTSVVQTAFGVVTVSDQLGQSAGIEG